MWPTIPFYLFSTDTFPRDGMSSLARPQGSKTVIQFSCKICYFVNANYMSKCTFQEEYQSVVEE